MPRHLQAIANNDDFELFGLLIVLLPSCSPIEGVGIDNFLEDKGLDVFP